MKKIFLTLLVALLPYAGYAQINSQIVYETPIQTAPLTSYYSIFGGTYSGYQYRANLGTGVQNTGFGYVALYNTTSGFANTAFGYYAVSGNKDGYGNTGIGSMTLFANENGFNNTAVGIAALQNNKSSYNTAMGRGALMANTTGSSNTAIGVNTQLGAKTFTTQDETTGSFNSSLGINTMFRHKSGQQNTIIGSNALVNTITGSYNTAIGGYALGVLCGTEVSPANPCGVDASPGTGAMTAPGNGGDFNTAVGYQSGHDKAQGNRNVFIGPFTKAIHKIGDNELNISNFIFGINVNKDTLAEQLSTAKIGIGTTSPQATLDVQGSFRIGDVGTPTATTACSAGEIRWDSGNIYVCVATNTWKRSVLQSL